MLAFADRYPVTPVPTTATFADVPVGSTYFAYIEATTRHGLMSGRQGNPFQLDNCGTNPTQYENNNLDYFKWCDDIQRDQMSKPIAQAANFHDDVTGRSSFSDIPTGHTFYPYIERLQMNGALEELPLHMPGRPACGTASVKPCYQPLTKVTRIDAVQLVWLARNKYYEYTYGNGPYGQAFPRRLSEINGEGGHDGVQAFVSTPSSIIPAGEFLAGPLGVADAVNLHFIESGPERQCTSTGDSLSTGDTLPTDDSPTACVNHPYASSSTGRICLNSSNQEIPCPDQARIDTGFSLTASNSYEYRSYYASGSNEWWSEYYNTDTKEWTRLITVTQMGTDRMREVFGAAETSSYQLSSDYIGITYARSHSPGGSWSGWCYDAGIVAPKMFRSSFSACPPPGVENFSWLAKYTKQQP
jgi:hypothetical protein